jgi:hypothetical protein
MLHLVSVLPLPATLICHPYTYCAHLPCPPPPLSLGGIDLLQELMGALMKRQRGWELDTWWGVDPIPIPTLSIRVGRPLATTRATAASLLQLIRDVTWAGLVRLALIC